MALGLSVSLDSIPGVSSLLSKLDNAKSQFLAVPAQVSAALDKLALVRAAMSKNNAPPSAQSDALAVEQRLKQVQSEWSVAAASLQRLDQARQSGGGLSLDLVTSAGHLLTSFSYVMSNSKSLMSSVDALAAKYLTPAQQARVNAPSGLALAGLSVPAWVLFGGALYALSRRRG